MIVVEIEMSKILESLKKKPKIPKGYRIRPRSYEKRKEENRKWLEIWKVCFPNHVKKYLKKCKGNLSFETIMDSFRVGNSLGEKGIKYLDYSGEFFIEKEDKVVGIFGADFWEKEIGGIHFMGILPEHRRKGLYRAMLYYAVKYLERKGAKKIRMTRIAPFVLHIFKEQGWKIYEK